MEIDIRKQELRSAPNQWKPRAVYWAVLSQSGAIPIGKTCKLRDKG